jgi:hypothetical protein
MCKLSGREEILPEHLRPFYRKSCDGKTESNSLHCYMMKTESLAQVFFFSI